MKRSRPLRRKTPLREVSPRRATARRPARGTGPDRTTRELVLERDDWRCVVCGEPVVGRRYSLHHRRNRAMGGSSVPAINAPSNLLTVCGDGTSGCHGWIGDRPEQARDEGFCVSLNGRQEPAEVAVRHAVHGLVRLDDEGGWRPC